MPYSFNMKTNPILCACEIAGGQSSLAKILGVSPPTINQWIKGVRPIPVERCSAIERATHGQVTRQELRPDDWADIWPELIEKSAA